MATYHLVTPSTRGIGLALSRHLLSTTPSSTHIVATHRPTSSPDTVRKTILEPLPNSNETDKRLHLLPLDFTDEATITNSIQTELPRLIKGRDGHLTRAYILPGILHPEKTLKSLKAEEMLETFRINTIAPTLILRELMLSGLLPRQPSQPECKLMIMAARVGSVSDNKLGGWYSYRMSKTAVFQLVKTAQIEAERAYGGRVSIMGYHPGTVRTGLSEKFWKGEGEGKFEAKEAVKKMVGVVEEGDRGGKVWDWKGAEVLP
ncbi:NAD(P)-binding protein [Ascobolus immersus RN42]|uniref:NAD(P)-binding protein n=1 Tax=Ascobolus immersus RN42 TaxID=1160509 RepID=A0A3N4IJF8_ASCIM|nr:NAD(P)-binding protein [Ascobolus immersus RN42]